ncbi:MAG: hypothetical protein NC412_10720 [Roseburia sp.]|nr:hypothetical protein [Roseburia sp.]MCM1279255.1 hypothetical protein [Robinsoniella sp.]
MSGKKKPTKITKYRHPLNINIGMIIFGIIFVYIIICVYMYFTSKHIIGYEVTTGSLSVSNVYTGLALRTEEPVASTQSGYVNYFAREGEHVGVGNLVCTIDESGKIADMIDTDDASIQLSKEDLSQMKTDIVNFTHNFTTKEFHSVYDFKYELKGTALKLSNHNMLSNLEKIKGEASGLVNLCNASKSGVVVYSVDGYEALEPSAITKDIMDEKKYEKEKLVANELVSNGDPLYKLVTDENWSIVIETTPERAEELLQKDYVNVKFLKNQMTSWGKVNVLQNEDGTYVKLDFNNSMITFAADRFVDIEIMEDEEEGLKIPNSAIVEKEFYLVPKDYIIKGGNSSKSGFMREVYTDGAVTTEFIETNIYSESDTDYYVDTITLRIGDYICKPDSTEKYPISKVGTLVGVYNINKGYADFKEITVLYSNDEYSIVKSNTTYGLSVYDHIVLEAESVKDDDFIH